MGTRRFSIEERREKCRRFFYLSPSRSPVSVPVVLDPRLLFRVIFPSPAVTMYTTVIGDGVSNGINSRSSDPEGKKEESCSIVGGSENEVLRMNEFRGQMIS